MTFLRRRTLLTSAGASAVALLAGCSTASKETAGTPTTQTTAQTVTETQTTSDTQSEGELDGGPGPLPETVWPLSRRGASNAAYLPDGPLFDSEPVVDWRVSPTTPPDQSFTPEFTSPVLAGDRLYTVNRLRFSTMEAAPDQHFLHCYDTVSGEQRWEFTIPHGSGRSVPTPPAVADENVLVGQDQRLYAVGTAEGSEAWSRRLEESIDAVYPTQERTYVRAHRSVVALTASDGQTWTKNFDTFPATLARGDENLYVTASRRLLALDPASGDVKWEKVLPAVDDGYGVQSLVTVADGVFALQNSGDLYAFSDTGTLVWHDDGQYRSISTDGTRLYARAGSSLRALGVSSGERVWEVGCGDVQGCDSGGSFRKPVVTDDAVYASHTSGRLVAVRPTDGTVVWTLDPGTDLAHLSLGSDALYGVGSDTEPLVRVQSPES